MDEKLAQKIIDRHETEDGLVQLSVYSHGRKIERHQHRLVEAGVQFNDWPTQPVSKVNDFYARPLALFMASRTDQYKCDVRFRSCNDTEKKELTLDAST